MVTKLCRGCNTERPTTEFHRHSRTKDGLQPRCKECQRISRAEWVKQNPERDAEIRKASYQRKGRDTQLRRLYGISEAEVEAMADEQGRRCAICGRHESESVNGLHVDHDHKTGNVRGLLCYLCNTALGKFEDNREALYHAILYLDRYEASKP